MNGLGNDLRSKIRTQPVEDVINNALTHLSELPKNTKEKDHNKDLLRYELESKLNEDSMQDMVMSEYRIEYEKEYEELIKLLNRAVINFEYEIE